MVIGLKLLKVFEFNGVLAISSYANMLLGFRMIFIYFKCRSSKESYMVGKFMFQNFYCMFNCSIRFGHWFHGLILELGQYQYQ